MRKPLTHISRRIASLKPAILLASCLLAGGCTERALSIRPADGSLKINFSWPEDAAVTGAYIWIYGSDGTLCHEAGSSAQAHKCRLPAGTYTVLAANSDMEGAVCDIAPDSWQESTVKAEKDEDTGTLRNIGNIFCQSTGGVQVHAGETVSEITLAPEDAVKELHFKIDTDGMPGLGTGDIRGISMRLTGIIPSVRLSDGTDAEEGTETLAAEARAYTPRSNDTYIADMYLFGWRGENIFTATIRHTGGSTDTIPRDISGELATLPEDGGEIGITLDLPDGKGSIGLTVTLESWESGSGSGTIQ